MDKVVERKNILNDICKYSKLDMQRIVVESFVLGKSYSDLLHKVEDEMWNKLLSSLTKEELVLILIYRHIVHEKREDYPYPVEAYVDSVPIELVFSALDCKDHTLGETIKRYSAFGNEFIEQFSESSFKK